MAVFLLISTGALADPAKDLGRELKRAAREERAFWKSFANRWSDVLKKGRDQTADGITYRESKRWEYEKIRYDLTGRLYDELLAIEAKRKHAFQQYSETDAPDTAPKLLDHLMKTCARIAKVEGSLDEARTRADVRPGLERTALARRRAALVEALARSKKTDAFLRDALAAATKKDKRGRIEHRMSVLEALGLIETDGARALLDESLDHEDYRLRIVTIESSLGPVKVPRARVATLLEDRSPVVRRALIQTIARHDRDKEWKAQLTIHRSACNGVELAECDAALTVIAGDKPVAPLGHVQFYGCTSPSNGVAFLIDGSQELRMPADWSRERRRPAGFWLRPRAYEYLSYLEPGRLHQSVIKEQLGRTLTRLSKGTHFNVVILGRANKLDDEVVAKRGLLGVTRGRAKSAVKLVEKYAKYGGAPDLAGLRFAMEIQARMLAAKKRKGPILDTVFLISDARESSGNYAHPNYALEAFRRYNRFARLVVHTVRISGGSDYRESWHKGLAESSGGSYVWARTPPRR